MSLANRNLTNIRWLFCQDLLTFFCWVFLHAAPVLIPGRFSHSHSSTHFWPHFFYKKQMKGSCSPGRMFDSFRDQKSDFQKYPQISVICDIVNFGKVWNLCNVTEQIKLNYTFYKHKLNYFHNLHAKNWSFIDKKWNVPQIQWWSSLYASAIWRYFCYQ